MEHRSNDVDSHMNILLSYLSLMDDKLLNAQRGLLDFLKSLVGHEQDISPVRDEIPLTPETIDKLRERITLAC